MTDLPYIDAVLRNENKDKFFEKSLHMHWGFWDDPGSALPSDPDNMSAATENMCLQMVKQAAIKEGMRLADIGCGFGGTISSINDSYHNIEMVGLNIDPRQLEVARSRVIPKNGNKIEFVTGDACSLPFEDASLDVVLAVECIFHFPDRDKFIAEVGRVLKPGGRLVFSDFVPSRKSDFRRTIGHYFVQKHYGGASPARTVEEYLAIGKRSGLASLCTLDITKNVTPTYAAIYHRIELAKKRLKAKEGLGIRIRMRVRRALRRASFSTWLLDYSHRKDRVRYMILGYQKTG